MAALEKPIFSVSEVAQILADLLGDYCACNFNGNDEWLPKICKHESECPNPSDRLACWKQYVIYQLNSEYRNQYTKGESIEVKPNGIHIKKR